MFAVLAAGAFYYSYLSNPRVVNSSSETVVKCQSSDAQNYYEKGETVFWRTSDMNSYSTTPDYCEFYVEGEYSRSGQLRQSYCSGNQVITEYVNCGIDSVCRQGRCFKGHIGEGRQLQTWSMCGDTDGGKNVNLRGSVQAINGSGVDECWVSQDKINPENNGSFANECEGVSCYVYEYFCDGDDRKYEIIPTPQGCANGTE